MAYAVSPVTDLRSTSNPATQVQNEGSFRFLRNIFGRAETLDRTGVIGAEAAPLSLNKEQLHANPVLPNELLTKQEQIAEMTPNSKMTYYKNRTYAAILTRIEHIIDSRKKRQQLYRDEDFKVFWKPDSESSQCHDCSLKFNYFRRRHHCRICGQIFCYACCEVTIPGKLLGCSDTLKGCTFCCKILYAQFVLHSTEDGDNLQKELKILKDQLAHLDPMPPPVEESSSSASSADPQEGDNRSRRGFGFVEDDVNSSGLKDNERDLLLSDSLQLKSLWYLIKSQPRVINLSINRWRLKVYEDSFDGRDLIKWLKTEKLASNHESAIAIGRASLKAGYIYCASRENCDFSDDYGIYKISNLDNSERKPSTTVEDRTQEPSWINLIPSQSDDCINNRDTVTSSPTKEHWAEYSSALSNSSYSLDLNLEENVVSISKSLKENQNDDRIGLMSADLTNSIRISASKHFSSYSMKDDKGFEVLKHLNSNQAEDYASEWQRKSEPVDAEGTQGENIPKSRLIKARLSAMWKAHETVLFSQLLELNGLPLSWRDVILPIAYKVINTVSPDVKHAGDLMDIRHYVNFKKVPGGQAKDSHIINGTVCTKNVVRTDMQTRLSNPQILMVAPAIDYLAHLNPMDLEPKDTTRLEAEYTRRILPQLLSCKPNLIICGNRVMFNALEQFLEANVTVVMNMKKVVMQRVARCTTAHIINCVDSELRAVPQFTTLKESPLGMCHSFYVRSYQVPHSGVQKTLMFFDGCASHLGCTIILRGGSNSELKRVKSVLRFTIFALHNWKLERSFLMDELIYVPSARRESLGAKGFLEADEVVNDDSKIVDISEEQSDGNEITPDTMKEINQSIGSLLSVEDENPRKPLPATSTPEKKKPSESVEDESDPLQSYFKEDLFNPNESRKLSSSNLTPRDTTFRKALEKTVLSVSPLVFNRLPFLESDLGKRCITRLFFPDNLYYSYALQPDRKRKFSDSDAEVPVVKNSNVDFKESHSYITKPILEPIRSHAVRAAIADYRARGCRIKAICKCDKNKYQLPNHVVAPPVKSVKTSYSDPVKMPEGMVDAFHPYNHQQLALHHFIFAQSNKDTQLCIQPRLMNIKFYGIKDYPLGEYLEKYCFDASLKCRTCKRELVNPGQTRNGVIHVMKFIHGKGAVEIILKKLDQSISGSSKQSSIYMWKSCQICNQSSSVIPMSMESWMFSFGKFMELLFYDNKTTLRDQTTCGHSLHQEHAHYFAQKNVSAVFKYTPISVKNLFIPPPGMEYIHENLPKPKLVEDIKVVSMEGHNIIARILSHLDQLLADDTDPGYKSYVTSLIEHYKVMNSTLKSEVGKIQLQMTSKDYVKFASDVTGNQHQASIMYDIMDQLVFIKRIVVRIVQDWKLKVQDLFQKKKELKSLDKSKSPSFIESKRKVAPQDFDISAPCFEESLPSGDIDPIEAEELRHGIEDKRKTMVRSSSNPEATKEISVIPKQRRVDNPIESDLATSDSYKASLSSSSGTCFSNSPDTSVEERAREDSVRLRRLCSSSEAAMSNFIRPGVKQFVSYKKDADEAAEKEKQGYGQSFKAIFSNLLGNSGSDVIKSPFSPSEHYNLMPEASVPVVIYDDEPSSIIAKALASQEYQKQLQQIYKERSANRQKSWETSQTGSNTSASANPDETLNHIALQWNDATSNYYCKVFFADRFHDLRELVFPMGEETFIRSLSRCANWDAKGGKSGSLFCKTTDDRFVLKEVSFKEMAAMDTFAPAFIKYLIDCKNRNQPTVFARIIGIYRIAFKNTETDSVLRRDLLVMENLFYQRNITHKYDLKGALRNREAKVEELEETEVVLLDKNLLKMACSSQFYLRPQGKTILTRSIDSDTNFLKQHKIMDYSLVVGIDEECNEMVVGIVDYIRPFTFDKKLEFTLKHIFSYPSGYDEKPTIISPDNYRKRFCEAMEKYFAFTPDKWVGLASPMFD